MADLFLSNLALPALETADLLVASKAFVHVDRIPAFHVLIHVLSGCIHVTEDGHDYALCAGDMLILREGVHHFGKTPIAAGTKWMYVHFHLPAPPAAPQNRQPSLQHVPVPCFLSRNRTDGLQAELLSLMERVRGDSPLAAFSANSQLYRILLILSEKKLRPPRKKSISEEIADYLRQNLEHPFSAKALEATFHLSYKHMAAVFKKHAGSTLQQYHTGLRITAAAQALRSTDQAIQSISLQYGFQDPLYFSRCFKKHMGHSPKQYRALQLLK